MSISRYYTVGAVVPDIRSFKELGDRLDALDPEPDSVVVLVRRRDRPLRRLRLGCQSRHTPLGLPRCRRWALP